jgi:hypothetical protein
MSGVQKDRIQLYSGDEQEKTMDKNTDDSGEAKLVNNYDDFFHASILNTFGILPCSTIAITKLDSPINPEIFLHADKQPSIVKFDDKQFESIGELEGNVSDLFIEPMLSWENVVTSTPIKVCQGKLSEMEHSLTSKSSLASYACEDGNAKSDENADHEEVTLSDVIEAQDENLQHVAMETEAGVDKSEEDTTAENSAPKYIRLCEQKDRISEEVEQLVELLNTWQAPEGLINIVKGMTIFIKLSRYSLIYRGD